MGPDSNINLKVESVRITFRLEFKCGGKKGIPITPLCLVAATGRVEVTLLGVESTPGKRVELGGRTEVRSLWPCGVSRVTGWRSSVCCMKGAQRRGQRWGSKPEFKVKAATGHLPVQLGSERGAGSGPEPGLGTNLGKVRRSKVGKQWGQS